MGIQMPIAAQECAGGIFTAQREHHSTCWFYSGTCNELVDELALCTSSAGVIEVVLLFFASTKHEERHELATSVS